MAVLRGKFHQLVLPSFLRHFFRFFFVDVKQMYVGSIEVHLKNTLVRKVCGSFEKYLKKTVKNCAFSRRLYFWQNCESLSGNGLDDLNIQLIAWDHTV